MDEPITFLASLPPIQTAIKVSGDGGARVQIDIPETELPAIARLLLMRGKELEITVREKRRASKPSAVEKWSR